jgi:zinc D-Ala-D-Ala carboxypeptidase
VSEVTDWSLYPNFSKAEFDCKHTGRNAMQRRFMYALQELRTEYGRPMQVTSGYRDPTHPVEAKKTKPGYHTQGLAVDIGCHSHEAYKIIELAFQHGFTGIGVSQKGGLARFVHLDMRDDTPRIYSY